MREAAGVDGYIIVPGIDGSGVDHWQTLWERRWGSRAIRIMPASWERPDLADWTDALREAFAAASSQADRVVLIAHSLGCWAAAEWVRQAEPPVAAAFLVAPPDPRGPVFPRARASTFLELPARPLPCRALVVASGDDPYCDTSASKSFASGWRAQWYLAGNHGHLSTDSGLADWPSGLELLDDFVRQAN